MALTYPQQLVEHALKATTAEQCVVIVQVSNSANLRWANNTLTTNGVMNSISVTVIAFHGAGNASVSGTVASLDQVDDLVARADAAALSAPPASDRAELITGAGSPEWDEPAGTTSIDVYRSFAKALGHEFDRSETEDRILYGFVNHDVTTTYVGSSAGLRLRFVQPTGHYGCTGKPRDLSTSAWVGGATRDFTDVSAHQMAEEITTRISWAARRFTLPEGRYDTVLPPGATADLMVDAFWSAGARTAHDGQSVYSHPGGGTKFNQLLVDPRVTLRSDATYSGLECLPFVVTTGSSNDTSVYDNGAPLQPTSWITDGRVSSLIQTRETAALTGLPFTPAIDNLILEVAGGAGSTADLVADVSDGLLLTCLWYIREVDAQTLLLTGLTRDGVYRVRDGEIIGAVNNFRFNESPIDLLSRFSSASSTELSFGREWGEDYFSRTATPALRVPDFLMSSVSQAL